MVDKTLYSVGITKAEAQMLVEAIEQHYFMVGEGEEELSAVYESLKEVAE